MIFLSLVLVASGFAGGSEPVRVGSKNFSESYLLSEMLAQLLEDSGYVAITKEFVGRRPRTTLSLTLKGRAAFRKYVDALETIVSLGQGKETGR